MGGHSNSDSDRPATPQKKSSWISRTAAPFRKHGMLRPARLIGEDCRNWLRRYPSDWKIFNQIILASAVYVFFTNLLPGLTFAGDLYVQTGKSWGTIEVVFSTGLCGVIFSLFSIQPLTILGVTGPFSVLAESIYALCQESFHIDFLSFMAWSLIHSGWMHILLALFNAHEWTMVYVTEFSCEIFSLLNSIIYFHKAVQELQRAQIDLPTASFIYSIMGAIGTFILALFLSYAESWEPLFHRYIRMGLREYAAAISIIFFIGMPHVGVLRHISRGTLAVSSEAFVPSLPGRKHFYVEFWTLPVTWVFAAMIPGAIITVLFFFDHEISSIICTIKRYGTRKPTGYCLDIVLLGLTTALCGILGIPPANGLLPQAPLHSESLMHSCKDEHVEQTVLDKYNLERTIQVPVQRVYEQRWSAFLHAGAILAFIAPPLQLVLGLTPTSVLAGLFIFMGQQSLASNPILKRTFYLLTPPSELPDLPAGVKSYWPVHAYTVFQIAMTVVVFIVTLTKGGPAFPILIIALVPFRLFVMNRLWSREVLGDVDRWACREGKPEDQLGEAGEREGQSGGGVIGEEDLEGGREKKVVEEEVEQGGGQGSGTSSGVEVEERGRSRPGR